MGYQTRDNFWFGTELQSSWMRTPLREASASPEAWSEGGTLLNGGGYQFTSWGSHKNYQFEWGPSSPYESAQKLKSYSDGTYGRGLIYFYDPLTYERNLFPARWADPSMALGYEGSGLVYGVEPTGADWFGPNPGQYPRIETTYDLALVASGWRGREDSLFLPIPTGYTLALGGRFSRTGAAQIFVRESNSGVLGATQPLPAGEGVSTFIESSDTVSGVWVYLGKNASGAGTVTISGLIARLVKTSMLSGSDTDDLGYGLEPYGETPYGGTDEPPAFINAPWVGGMGHSGCRFNGKPTFDITGPYNGGQAGYAASFREVGSFAY